MTMDLMVRSQQAFAFGPFVLIPERQLLLEDGTPIRIGGRARDILTVLVKRAGEVVSKRELFSLVWPNTVVEDCNLKVNVAALRRTLGDGVDVARYIATVTGRGYRFVAPVQTSGSPGLMLAPSATERRSHNLPTGTTRIFGRERAIDTFGRELDGSRLLSIVGTGGIGKTTVALAIAERAVGSFRDGVWLIDLTLPRDPDLVPDTIAAAIGATLHASDRLGALCDLLHAREMLLVLDSCEHFIDAVAACSARILAEVAGVKLLATSREPLQVCGERVRRLPALDTPPVSPCPTADEALAFPAVELFVARARDKLESFELGDADAPLVAEICRRLDGLPLAIELAATRIDTFGLGGLSKQLDDRVHLRIDRRASPERHRTLAATLDWSYRLLSAGEVAMLRAVSVFVGAFDVESASVVSNVPLAKASEVLARLVAKSLLTTKVDADGMTYRLLETTRADCLERLRVSGEGGPIRRRHVEHRYAVIARAAREWAQRPAREWVAANQARHALALNESS